MDTPKVVIEKFIMDNGFAIENFDLESSPNGRYLTICYWNNFNSQGEIEESYNGALQTEREVAATVEDKINRPAEELYEIEIYDVLDNFSPVAYTFNVTLISSKGLSMEKA